MSTRYLKFPNGSIWPVEIGTPQTVTAVVPIALEDIHCDFESFLDHLSEEAVGCSTLMQVGYRILGGQGTTLMVEVTGDITSVLEIYGVDDGTNGQDRASYSDPQDRDSYTVDEDDDALTEATFEEFAQSQGWLDCEVRHAADSLGNAYGDETVIGLFNGREIRCPSYPAECDYVRITALGFELAYWNSDEWQEAPAEVMGAILGAARHGDPQ